MRYRYVLLALIFIFTCAAGSNEVPNFKLQDLHKKDVDLYELLGQGPVLLDFWATWCKPCLKAFPKLNELHTKYADQGLTILGINEDSNRNQAKIKPFVKSLGLKFEVAIDGNNDIMRLFGVTNLPATILISPGRRIVSSSFGFSPDKFEKLEKQIEEMLRDSKKAMESDNESR